MSSFAVSYSELCEELINCGNNIDLLNDFIKTKNSVLTINEVKLVRRAIQKRFITHFNQRWVESQKKKSYFFTKNDDWLKSCIFKVSVADDRPSCSRKRRRPVEEFDDCEESFNPNYKRTTDKQYSLLNHEMARFSAENYEGKLARKFWNVLTEKLNAMGPPYRTVAQWKKVWSDHRRFHRRKAFKSQPQYMKIIKNNANKSSEEAYRSNEEGEDITQTGYKTSTTNKSKVADYLRSESEEYEQNYESMHSTLSNDFVDEYSYPDRHSQQQQQSTQEALIANDATYDTLNYSQEDDDVEEIPQTHETSNVHIINAPTHRSPPPLQPGNTRLIDQTLYTLQNQIEHQTKLLEHLSQISSTMTTLMERQVNAIEKQTEAIRRQASATEHHTLVMNSFVDMIREKMPKVNSKTNLSNGS